MTQSVHNNFLDPSVGISRILDMPEGANLPRAREIATNVLREAGLEELYRARNARSAAEELLVPDVGDGRMLAPEAFSNELVEIVRKCQGSSDPDVRAMVDQELIPLLQNAELLQVYQGLMIGG